MWTKLITLKGEVPDFTVTGNRNEAVPHSTPTVVRVRLTQGAHILVRVY